MREIPGLCGMLSMRHAVAMRIEVAVADITTLAVEAIVNAANPALSGGGGVDGAIHRVAGPRLAEACKAVPLVAPYTRCPTGQARITPGFGLPAKHVIHTVGPVWRGGRAGEPALLAACYRNSLALAAEHGIGDIAFPAISCGVYGYPPSAAAQVAVSALCDALATTAPAMRVLLCSRDDAMAGILRDALDSRGARQPPFPQ